MLAVVMIFTSMPFDLRSYADDTGASDVPKYGIVIHNVSYKEENNSTLNRYRITFSDHNGDTVSLDKEIHLEGSVNDLYLMPDPLTGTNKGRRGGIIEMDTNVWANLSGTKEFQDFLLTNKIKSVRVEMLEEASSTDSMDEDGNTSARKSQQFLSYGTEYNYYPDDLTPTTSTSYYRTYSGPHGNGITQPLKVQAMDEAGNLLFEEDGITPIMVDSTSYGFAVWDPTSSYTFVSTTATGTTYIDENNQVQPWPSNVNEGS